MTDRKLKEAAKFLLPVLVLSGAMVVPAAAQQFSPQQHAYNQDVASPTQQDNLRTIAANVSEERAQLLRKKDAAGIAALYTPDATFVELLPRLDVMHGRGQIEGHFRDLLAANTSDLMPTVTVAEMAGNGMMIAGGDYALTVGGGKKIYGHFFQTLRQEGRTWKILSESFARPEPVTAVETNQYNSASGG